MAVAPISADAAYEAGRAAFPTIDLPREAFLRFVEARAQTWAGHPERAPDLYLACACVEKIPAAIGHFLSTFGKRIPHYLGRLGRNSDVVNEVRQIIATRCIVGDGVHPPALTSYSATGSLEGWLRATAVREALAINRQAGRQSGDVQAALEAQIAWADQEISFLKQTYREPVSRAFAAACLELDAQDRTLLRLHYAEGVTTADLAKMFGVSRATLIRRLAAARGSLVDRVKAALAAAAGVNDRDFNSVLRLVKSQIDLRLSVLLKTPE
jgi:RNA polymerase sigma-70 factor (ECF subfamily)